MSNGPYDVLYRAGFLWPERPGRMVKLAAESCSPGAALDLGCGDGKNMIYLVKRGWYVDGLDISPVAVEAANRRIAEGGLSSRARVWLQDAVGAHLEEGAYDLAISYGLYHCLSDDELSVVHAKVDRAVKPGGLLAFAAFNDELPIPEGHLTEGLHLRPRDHIFTLVPGWTVLAQEFGEIEESHPPLVDEHKHALTWALFRKP